MFWSSLKHWTGIDRGQTGILQKHGKVNRKQNSGVSWGFTLFVFFQSRFFKLFATLEGEPNYPDCADIDKLFNRITDELVEPYKAVNISLFSRDFLRCNLMDCEFTTTATCRYVSNFALVSWCFMYFQSHLNSGYFRVKICPTCITGQDLRQSSSEIPENELSRELVFLALDVLPTQLPQELQVDNYITDNIRYNIYEHMWNVLRFPDQIPMYICILPGSIWHWQNQAINSALAVWFGELSSLGHSFGFIHQQWNCSLLSWLKT